MALSCYIYMRRVKMKLSSETIEVLKNFSNINQNILIKEGLPLYEIKIWETPTSSVVYRGGEKFKF